MIYPDQRETFVRLVADLSVLLMKNELKAGLRADDGFNSFVKNSFQNKYNQINGLAWDIIHSANAQFDKLIEECPEDVVSVAVNSGSNQVSIPKATPKSTAKVKE